MRDGTLPRGLQPELCHSGIVPSLPGLAFLIDAFPALTCRATIVSPFGLCPPDAADTPRTHDKAAICGMLTYRAGGTMTLTAALLGSILLAIVCGGIYIYRALLAIVRLLEQINGKLPAPGIVTSLLSI